MGFSSTQKISTPTEQWRLRWKASGFASLCHRSWSPLLLRCHRWSVGFVRAESPQPGTRRKSSAQATRRAWTSTSSLRAATAEQTEGRTKSSKPGLRWNEGEPLFGRKRRWYIQDLVPQSPMVEVDEQTKASSRLPVDYTTETTHHGLLMSFAQTRFHSDQSVTDMLTQTLPTTLGPSGSDPSIGSVYRLWALTTCTPLT